MKTLITILFIGLTSLQAQREDNRAINLPYYNSKHFSPDTIRESHFMYLGDTSGDKNENLVWWYHPKNHTPSQCECCSEWYKQIGQKTVLIYSYKPLLDYYKDSATTSAIKDHMKEIQSEIDELLKKAIDCR